MSASSSPDVAPARWSLPTRIAFRFFFSFFLLYLQMPFFVSLPRLNPAVLRFWDAIVSRVGRAVFGVAVKWEPSGSGDTTWNWVQLFVMVVTSLAITILWSIVDRRRLAYPRLHAFLRIYVRFALALAMFMYGIVKVIPMQFSAPPLERLLQPVGEMSPMGLLWTFMGYSAAYTIFAGLGEMLGGLLLTTRRTALLGALITAAVMTNVAIMNFAYDVPVKIYSSILLLAASFIIAPDAKRLFELFVLNRAVEPRPLHRFVRQPWLHNTLRVLRTLAVILFVSQTFQRTLYARRTFRPADERAALHGIWNVDELTVDGVARPPLLTDTTRWRRVIFSGNRGVTIQFVNDSRERYGVMHDLSGFILKKRDNPLWQASFFSKRPDPRTLLVDGHMDGHKIVATLHKQPEPKFLLTSRGFHWINEQPFNR